MRSRLFQSGAPTAIKLPGYRIVHQFEIDLGYILVTDYDCPFEEVTNFILLGKDLRALGIRSLGAPYCSVSVDRIEWLDPQRFMATCNGDRWLVTIRPWGIPYLRPRFKIER